MSSICLVDHRGAAGEVKEIWKTARGKEVVVKGDLPETSTKG